MEECSVLIETTKSAKDKTSRWFDLPIDYELLPTMSKTVCLLLYPATMYFRN